jgi:hypothetical protein
LSIKPVDQSRNLPASDLSLLDAVEQMVVQLPRNISTQHLGHILRPVKTLRQRGPESRDLRRVFRFRQLIGQLTEFFTTELAIASQLDSKPDYLSLLGRGQLLYVINHFCRCHGTKVKKKGREGNERNKGNDMFDIDDMILRV